MDLGKAVNEFVGMLLPGWNELIAAWYLWGVFVGFLVALAAMIWILFDGGHRGPSARTWKVLSIVAAVLELPALYVRLDPLSAVLLLANWIVPAAYLGLVGLVLALAVVAFYSFYPGQARSFCPTCGRPMHPSWDRCPYCQLEEPEGNVEVQIENTVPHVQAEPMTFERAPQATMVITKTIAQMAWLVITSGPRTGQQFRLEESTGIGRDAAQNQIALDDPSVSRQHAKVKLEAGRFVLYDLASANGIFVNGQQVYRHILTNGDKIKMGETTLAFMELENTQDDPESGPASPAPAAS